RTAHHGHTVEPTTRDAQIDQIRREQPAPLSATGTMRIHGQIRSFKDPWHDNGRLDFNRCLFPGVQAFDESRGEVTLDRVLLLIQVVDIEQQGIHPTTDEFYNRHTHHASFL